MLEDDDSDSIGTVSDDDVEGDEQMSDQTKAFLQDDLTDLVKQIVQPVVIRLLAQPDEVPRINMSYRACVAFICRFLN